MKQRGGNRMLGKKAKELRETAAELAEYGNFK
jgi:hypothetical protein